MPLHIFPRIFANEECKKAQDTRFTILPYVTKPLYDGKKVAERRKILNVVKLLMKKMKEVAPDY